MRPQWDVKPLGQPFDGSGIQTGPPSDVGGLLGAPLLSPIASGLSPAQPYRWRERLTSSSPFFRATPWLTPPANNLTETDLRTGCDAVAPAGSPSLAIARSGESAQLSWSGLTGATGYDVVRGALALLRSTGGSFAAATQECLADNTTATSLSHAPLPVAGDGFWYLVRGVASTTAACGAAGTYDTGAPSQVASRDPGIAASPAACP